jgi:folate-binding Fe-S cluster repair protein YgfZ
MARIARLPERSTVTVEGPDAQKFLQDLITNDLDLLTTQSAVHAGLLSPQGKILFEFIVVPSDRGFVLDIVRARAAELVKRLTLYKLRAKIAISDRGEDQDVYAAWGDGASRIAPDAYADPRLPELGVRLIRAKEDAMPTSGLPRAGRFCRYAFQRGGPTGAARRRPHAVPPALICRCQPTLGH